MKLSVVVPFYNESQNIFLVLEEFNRFRDKYDFELLCVNDGSKDNTSNIFEELERTTKYPFAKYTNYYPNAGYGNAIMTGVRKAEGDVIAWTHSDLQTPVENVFRALSEFESKKEQDASKVLIKGWRVNRTIQQVILSFGMAIIASIVLRRKLTEINAQPKLFPKELAPYLANAPKDFSLDLYLICMAQNNGYKVKAINVKFPDRIHGESSWAFSWKSKWKTIWRSIKYIWRIRKEI